jgi:hypothetical protein
MSKTIDRVEIISGGVGAGQFRRRMMETGRYGTINELASAEKINSSCVSRLLRLTRPAPNIVRAILEGRQPDGLTLPGLMEPFTVEWGRQKAATHPSRAATSPTAKCWPP